MTTKEKVLALTLQLAAGNHSDATICQNTGLTTADLDRLWSGAEKVLDKARNKPAVTPTGQALVDEIKSWIDYYTWDD